MHFPVGYCVWTISIELEVEVDKDNSTGKNLRETYNQMDSTAQATRKRTERRCPEERGGWLAVFKHMEFKGGVATSQKSPWLEAALGSGKRAAQFFWFRWGTRTESHFTDSTKAQTETGWKATARKEQD